LLQQAFDLVQKQDPTQADLRRGISAAYYALFHLLISETVMNWRFDESRNTLARMFDHGVMARVSNRIVDPRVFPYDGVDPLVVGKLRKIAKSFTQLQDNRHIADYDNATYWTSTDAAEEVKKAAIAFIIWQEIRNEKIAQDYLVSLLIKPRN